MSDTPTVVLVHGLAIRRRADRMFLGVAEHLRLFGLRVETTRTQGDGTLEELAARVWAQLEKLEGPLALVCHSMGGLQSRTFLLDDRKAPKIRAIATLGSPHAGTPVAPFAAPFGRAYRELTPGARRRWHDLHAADERAQAKKHGVALLSGVAKLSGGAPSGALCFPHAALRSLSDGDDGLVPAASQVFGDRLFEVDLDHLECGAMDPLQRRQSEVLAAWRRLAEAAVSAKAA